MPIRTWESEEYHPFWQRSNNAYLDRVERRILRGLMGTGGWFIDLGGGYGRLMDLYKDAYQKVVISDYSMSMLEDANRRLSRNGIRNISLVAADVNRLPFIDGVFEAAMMIRLIHHIENPGPAIREVRRILKPGALFIFEYQNKRNFNFLIKARLGRMKGKDLTSLAPFLAGRLYWNFHPRAMERILAEGFDIDRVLGGGIFWNRKFLTAVIPKLEVIDSGLARFLGRRSLTHQLFLRLHARKDESRLERRSRIQEDSVVGILRCLVCGQSELEHQGNRLTCSHCHQSYAIHDNIYDFRLESK